MEKFTQNWQKVLCGLVVVSTLSSKTEAVASNSTDPGTGKHLASDGTTASTYFDWPITGTVVSAAGEPLPGVTVLLKGTTRGTATGADGTFSINVPEQAGTLVFSFIGSTTVEKAFTGPTSMNVTLADDTKALDEVVVVGYGTQKKEAVTGAISSVSAKEIAELPVPSVAQAMQGRVAGVTVVNTGTPGTAPIVRIRGVGSVNFNAEPLYVVDGVPTGGLNGIDTKDIASVDVLKDAAATAVYGSRAANGVVIVTTKSGGRDGKMRVSIDSNIGTQHATNKLDLLNTEQYVQYATMLIRNADPDANLPSRLSPDEFNKPIYPGATQTYAQTNTDWQDELFRSGLITQNNVTLSGGNEKSQFFTNAGYFKQEGIMQGVGFERYSLRLNSTHTLSYGHSSGKVQDRAEFVEDVVNGPFDFLTLEAVDQTIKVTGETAIVRHIFTSEATNNGSPASIRIGNMQVWQKQNGEWKLLARQAFKL